MYTSVKWAVSYSTAYSIVTGPQFTSGRQAVLGSTLQYMRQAHGIPHKGGQCWVLLYSICDRLHCIPLEGRQWPVLLYSICDRPHGIPVEGGQCWALLYSC